MSQKQTNTRTMNSKDGKKVQTDLSRPDSQLSPFAAGLVEGGVRPSMIMLLKVEVFVISAYRINTVKRPFFIRQI